MPRLSTLLPQGDLALITLISVNFVLISAQANVATFSRIRSVSRSVLRHNIMKSQRLR